MQNAKTPDAKHLPTGQAALAALAAAVLPPVALPRALAQRIAAAHPTLSVVRCAHPALGLGLALSLLGGLEPFARAPLGLRTRLTAGEITRGHHLLVLDRGHPVAYAGWACCTEAEAARFLGAEGIGALDMTRREGEVLAFLTLAAVSAPARETLRLVVRAVLGGRPYVARRLHAPGGRLAERPVVPKRGVVAPLRG